MKRPIDTAILLMANLERRDFECIRKALVQIAGKLQLSAMDSEQVSMAIRIVKSHPNFLEGENIVAARKALLADEEGQKAYSAIEETLGKR